MSELTIRRNRLGTLNCDDRMGDQERRRPPPAGFEGIHKRGSLQPVWKGREPSLFLPG